MLLQLLLIPRAKDQDFVETWIRRLGCEEAEHPEEGNKDEGGREHFGPF